MLAAHIGGLCTLTADTPCSDPGFFWATGDGHSSACCVHNGCSCLKTSKHTDVQANRQGCTIEVEASLAGPYQAGPGDGGLFWFELCMLWGLLSCCVTTRDCISAPRETVDAMLCHKAHAKAGVETGDKTSL